MIEGVLAKAKKRCEQAEIFESESSALIARSSLDRLEACKSTFERGYGLRIVSKGRIGFSFFMREEDAPRAIDEALRSARLSHREKYSLPGPSRPSKAKCFDPRVAALGEAELVDMLLEGMDATSESAEPLNSQAEAGVTRTRVVSTEGVDAETRDTVFTMFCVGKKAENFGDDFYSSKRLGDCAATVGRSAGEWSAKGKGAKPMDYSGSVTLHQDAIAEFLEESVMRNLNGEVVRRGKSRWGGKIGQRVTGDYTLTDNPLLDWGVGTAVFDDEGIPTAKRAMISRGVLKALYYDTRTANLAGTESTGNGFRAGFSTLPAIGSTNVVIEPARRASQPEGLFVKSLIGFHNMNPVSGDFSLDIGLALLGDKPVRGCVLSGNIFSILERGVWCGPTETREWLTSPLLSFDGKVVGK